MIITYARDDESPISWLIRLARANGATLKDFLKSIHCDDILKGPIDINADWSVLKNHLKPEFIYPLSLQEKLNDLNWYRGKSKWLIEPNKSGSARFNSFTQYCPNCLKTKGYFQQKWKISIIQGCVECGILLLKNCPKCQSVVSPFLTDKKTLPHEEKSYLFSCYHCQFDLREAQSFNLVYSELEKLNLTVNAFTEIPCNLVYLKHLLNTFP